VAGLLRLQVDGVKVNWYRLVGAVMFFVHQNMYYGWNEFPKSEGELIADGVTFLLFALSVRMREEK
jgi:hypothetical protein